MKCSTKLGWAYFLVVAVALALAVTLRAQSSASPANKTITITFVGGWEPPGKVSAGPEIQLVYPYLEQLNGYTVTIVEYTWNGTSVSNPARTLTEDLQDNPNQLNNTVCFSMGCGQVQVQINASNPAINELVALDPYMGALPLAMQLNSNTQVWMIYSNPADSSGFLSPGLPPANGNVVSSITLPTGHETLLIQSVATLVLMEELQDMLLGMEIFNGTDGIPGDPTQLGGPFSGVPSPGGEGAESRPLTNIKSKAFETRSEYRYFHRRR